MTCSDNQSRQDRCCLEDSTHDEERAVKDQSFEERLLLIELTEVQRQLQHAKVEAADAHAAANAASTQLSATTESMQQDIGMLTAQIHSLRESLDAERKRADHAVQELDLMLVEVSSAPDSCAGNKCASTVRATPDSLAIPGDSVSIHSQNSDQTAARGSESAVWHALHEAQNDAAVATSRAAEATVLAGRYQNQLKQAHEEQHSLLRAMASAVGMCCDDETEDLCQHLVVARAQEIISDVECLQGELETVRARLRDEQTAALQIHEDLLREKRASKAAVASAAAKQRQLDHWSPQDGAPDTSDSHTRTDRETSVVLSPVDEVAHPLLGELGTDVADIVSKWRFMSMQQVSEANGLADQLASERKALQSMRAQALMLERQVETAEDQLDSERSSAASRESSMRTQLGNLEAQLAEQERLLILKTSALAAAEAQAEGIAAELFSANERVRALEDMVKSAEVELQSAIRQMSDMQTMVMSTDVKLRDAQAAMEDRDSALPGLKRLLVLLSSECNQESAALESWPQQSATSAVQDAEQLVAALVHSMASTAAACESYIMRCESLEHEIAALKCGATKAHDDLAFQYTAAAEKQCALNEVMETNKLLNVQLAQKTVDIEQIQLELQKASSLVKERTGEAQECEKTLVKVHAELDRVKADSQHANGQLTARSEEVACVRKQLKAADEQNVKMNSRLRDLNRELATCRAHVEAAAESQAASHQEADDAHAKLRGLSGRLEESEARVNSMQVAMEKRNQEVRELNSMLKAWEAMRLSKDAQIAALMERCKRYDEDIAEKGRSNEALRRKLMHHHGSGSSRGSLHTLNGHALPQQSMAGSVAGSLSGSDGGRTRHIHLHMHGAGGTASSCAAPPGRPSFIEVSQLQRRDFHGS